MSIKSTNKIKYSFYIDGANFYEGLKKLKKGFSDFNLDFWKFSHRIIPEDGEIVKINYYNAPFKKKIDVKLYNCQRNFIIRMKSENINVILFERHLLSNKIKGDDVQIAVDMVWDAIHDKYDWAVLISGDADFCPAIEKIQMANKKVMLLSFYNSSSFQLQKIADSYREISNTLIRKSYITKK